ncbi:hypothetical protein O9K63_03135 [Janibacter cremeus]|uniref:hypothetical protein n=1 Tax=Janibacter cremeus TaxID=1285192 RepID=UPI0023F9047B|nr:hypothetical protein [Janibacter cremeus]WEV78804.1 hypothetical protein O9K63_03135 [Janibacter cremeus]
MDTTSHTMGEGGLARLAQRVLAEWQESHGTAAEEVEFCEECGGFCDDLDPEEREMAEQWAAWQPRPVGPGGRGTGWVWDSGGVRDLPLPGWAALGWPGGVRFEDL